MAADTIRIRNWRGEKAADWGWDALPKRGRANALNTSRILRKTERY